MDRRQFLKRGGAATAVGVISIAGFNHLTADANGQTLYVNFTNPKPGAAISVPMPFAGRFRGIRKQEPPDATLAVMKEQNDLTVGQLLPEGAALRVVIKDCPIGIESLSVHVVMERM